MKKFYVLFVVCLLVITSGFAQTFTWVGLSGGNWSDPTNWSGSSGFPNSASHDVIFNTSVSVNLDAALTSVTLNTLSITNTSVVKLIATKNMPVTVGSTSSVNPGLSIEGGSKMEDSTLANSFFEFFFAAGAKADISGTWKLTGHPTNGSSTFTLPATSGQGNQIAVNSGGAIIFTNNSFSPDNVSPSYLVLNGGSLMEFTGSGGVIIPKGLYNTTSTVKVSGLISSGVAFDESSSIGNFTYDCPNQTSDLGLTLLGTTVQIKGNLRISSTNNKLLTILGNGSVSTTLISVTLQKDLIIENNSAVVLSSLDADNKTVSFTVQGNITMSGTSFSLQNRNSNNIQPTTLFLNGNLIHTAGTFGATSTAINDSTSLFVVEMSSINPQLISSINGSIDNAGHQVTLRINNSSSTGVTLNSTLQVGRLSFNSTLAGKVTTTSTNILTVNNTSGGTIVIKNTPGFDGFVNGPIRRNTTLLKPLLMPTGKGSAYRPVTLIPTTAGANTYEATYFNTATPNSGQLLTPVRGVSNTEYWGLSRIAGTAAAQVQFTLAGAIPGANPSDFIFATNFTGGNWTNAKGTTGNVIAGNSTNGTVLSEAQSTLSGTFFTFGYAAQSALPIILVSFTAKKDDDYHADLNWKITENSTPASFEALKSTDGVNFVAIGSVAGQEGKLDYTLTDNHLSTGNNYYRLRMVDKDGSITLSNIIAVINGVKGVIISSLMPSVVTDRTRLSVSSSLNANMQLIVTDIHGRILQQQVAAISAGSQEIWINAAALPAGLYQVSGFINGEKTKTLRFIKK